MEKLSVIIPVYNARQYLEEAVDSVCRQEYPNIEIILIDDGSIDGSSQICDELMDQHDNIKVVHQKNAGPSAARNVGLDMATGDYVCFLDSDDYVDEKLFSIVLPLMKKKDMVIFSYATVDNYGQKSGQKIFSAGNYEMNTFTEKTDFLFEKFFTGNIGWEVWNRVFNRNIIEYYKIRFVEDVNIAEDLFFCLCYLLHAKKIICVKDTLYYHRQRAGSLMVTEGLNPNIMKMKKLLKTVFAHIEEWPELFGFKQLFPAIRFIVISNRIRNYIRSNGRNIKDKRVSLLEDIGGDTKLLKEIKDIKGQMRYLNKVYQKTVLAENLSIIQYLIDNKYYVLAIKMRIINKLY